MATVRPFTGEVPIQAGEILAAYLGSPAAVQSVVRDMMEIVRDPDADPVERTMAWTTVIGALRLSRRRPEESVDLGELERIESSASAEARDAIESLDREESHFASRVKALLADRLMTQANLADACGIGPSAISMLLSRQARPQRRTVEKVAKALGVTFADLWPVDGA